MIFLNKKIDILDQKILKYCDIQQPQSKSDTTMAERYPIRKSQNFTPCKSHAESFIFGKFHEDTTLPELTFRILREFNLVKGEAELIDWTNKRGGFGRYCRNDTLYLSDPRILFPRIRRWVNCEKRVSKHIGVFACRSPDACEMAIEAFRSLVREYHDDYYVVITPLLGASSWVKFGKSGRPDAIQDLDDRLCLSLNGYGNSIITDDRYKDHTLNDVGLVGGCRITCISYAYGTCDFSCVLK